MSTRLPKFIDINPNEWGTFRYDLSIFALGFESRAINFVVDVSKNSSRSVAVGFSHGKKIAYESNKESFIENGVEIMEDISDPEFQAVIDRYFPSPEDQKEIKIFIDISCFSRYRLAAIACQIQGLVDAGNQEIVVDFGYSLAKFEEPAYNNRPNLILGPTHPFFSGWSHGGSSSTAAVLGLGYEQDQALGVVEYLQAGEVWAFSPNSPIQEYKQAVRQANDLLLSEIDDGHVLEYNVCNPSSTIARIESVIRGLSDDHSIVLIPFGPKVFVLCALLVAASRREVAVWRVSQGSGIEPTDRAASTVRIGLRMQVNARRL